MKITAITQTQCGIFYFMWLLILESCVTGKQLCQPEVATYPEQWWSFGRKRHKLSITAALCIPAGPLPAMNTSSCLHGNKHTGIFHLFTSIFFLSKYNYFIYPLICSPVACFSCCFIHPILANTPSFSTRPLFLLLTRSLHLCGPPLYSLWQPPTSH